MPTPIVQILAIVRYELKMQQRSKALPGLTLGLLAVLGLTGLLTKDQILVNSSGGGVQTLTLTLISIVGSCLYVVLTIVSPPFVADFISRDRQLEVSEVLNSTCLSRWAYLVAKLLSVWLGMLAVVTVVLVAAGIWFWLIFGGYDVGISLQAIIVVILPLTLLNPGLSLLAAASQNTRRGAILIGVAVSFSSLFLMMLNLQKLAFWKDTNAEVDWGDLLSLSRPALFRQINFGFLAGTNPDPQAISSFSYYNGAIGLSILAGILELCLVGWLMWLWLGLRDNK